LAAASAAEVAQEDVTIFIIINIIINIIFIKQVFVNDVECGNDTTTMSI